MNVHCWSYNVENNKAFTTNSELPCLFNKYSFILMVLLLFVQISKTTVYFIIHCLFNYERGSSPFDMDSN